VTETEGVQITGPAGDRYDEILTDEALDHFIEMNRVNAKKLALDFRAAFLKANNVPTTDGFSAYSFDAWMIFTTAATRALKTAKPGTVEFRKALRDEILNTNELPGVHAVYNFKPGAYHGVDERALVIVRLINGAWTYEP